MAPMILDVAHALVRAASTLVSTQGGRALILAATLLCPAVPAQTPDLDQAFAKAATWDFDQDRDPLQAVADLIAKAHGNPTQLREIERRLIALLQSNIKPGAKDFACKQLSLIGTEAAVPALAAMLRDPKTSDIARYALERIPGAGANRALGEALAKSSGKPRIGIIATLGRRQDAASVAWLRPLAQAGDQQTAAAALFALAEIADTAALEILLESRNKAAAEAYLKAADRLAERNNKADALAIYQKLYAADVPPIVRAGALHGIAATGGAESIPVLLQALRGDARLQAVAIRELAPTSAKQLAAEMPRVSAAGQVRILAALAARDDRSALPVFTAALNSTSPAVRVAALEGVGLIGDASQVPLLAKVAAGDDETAKAAARASLVRIHGDGVDPALVALLSGTEPKIELEAVRAAGDRGLTAAAPALLKLARDADESVRRAALRGLRTTASTAEISGLVAVLVNPVQSDDRAEAVRSLAAILRRNDPSRIQDVIAAYKSAGDADTRAALMDTMGQSGNPQSLDTLRAALGGPNAETKRAAILALTAWPNDGPATDLIETARIAAAPAHQILALRGALRLIGLPGSSRTPRETVKLLAEIMSLARRPEEKRAVLALLPRFPVPEALELAKASLDTDVNAEAKVAAGRLERQLR